MNPAEQSSSASVLQPQSNSIYMYKLHLCEPSGVSVFKRETPCICTNHRNDSIFCQIFSKITAQFRDTESNSFTIEKSRLFHGFFRILDILEIVHKTSVHDFLLCNHVIFPTFLLIMWITSWITRFYAPFRPSEMLIIL